MIKTLWFFIAASLLAACGAVSHVMPQGRSSTAQSMLMNIGRTVPQYSVVELPSLGGGFSFGSAINNSDVVAGTSLPSGGAGVVGTLWRHGSITPLRTLGGPNTIANILNDSGFAAGYSETPALDPLGEDFGQDGTHTINTAVAWDRGRLIVLPTLGGHNASVGFGFNDRGQTVGFAETGLHDPTCAPPQVLQIAAAVWDPMRGTVRKLPPLSGDRDAEAASINQKGEIVGASGTCASVYPNGNTGTHSVLWRNGKPIDLGNLGGSTYNVALSINNRSQVVGYSDLPGDTTRHAYLWQNGAMSDLGTLPGDLSSRGFWINDRQQIVGISCDATGNCRSALWQNGMKADLNDLVPANSPVYLVEAFGINSRGEVTGIGIDKLTSDVVAYLAIPTGSQVNMAFRTPFSGRFAVSARARRHIAHLRMR